MRSSARRYGGPRRRRRPLQYWNKANRDWASLPADLLVLISKKLDSSIDYVRFRSVCSFWRSTVPCMRFLPLLMLPLQHEEFLFYDFAYGKVHSIPLTVDATKTAFLGSSRGWLFLIDEFGFVSLFNPFTQAKFSLPPVTQELARASDRNVEKEDNGTWVNHYRGWGGKESKHPVWLSEMRRTFISEAILLSSPRDADGCLVVAVLADSASLAFCRLGENKWKLRHTGQFPVDSVAYCGERLYAMDGRSQVVVFKADSRTPALDFLVSLWLPHQFDPFRMITWGMELLLVGQPNYSDAKHFYKVYQCNLTANSIEWSKVESLADRTVFVSGNFKSNTIVGKFSGCKGNSIWLLEPNVWVRSRFSSYWLHQRIQMLDLADGNSQEVACNEAVESSIDISWFTPCL